MDGKGLTGRFGNGVEITKDVKIEDIGDYKRLIQVKENLESALLDSANMEKPSAAYITALTNAIGSLNRVKKFW